MRHLSVHFLRPLVAFCSGVGQTDFGGSSSSHCVGTSPGTRSGFYGKSVQREREKKNNICGTWPSARCCRHLVAAETGTWPGYCCGYLMFYRVFMAVYTNNKTGFSALYGLALLPLPSPPFVFTRFVLPVQRFGPGRVLIHDV